MEVQAINEFLGENDALEERVQNMQIDNLENQVENMNQNPVNNPMNNQPQANNQENIGVPLQPDQRDGRNDQQFLQNNHAARNALGALPDVDAGLNNHQQFFQNNHGQRGAPGLHPDVDPGVNNNQQFVQNNHAERGAPGLPPNVNAGPNNNHQPHNNAGNEGFILQQRVEPNAVPNNQHVNQAFRQLGNGPGGNPQNGAIQNLHANAPDVNRAGALENIDLNQHNLPLAQAGGNMRQDNLVYRYHGNRRARFNPRAAAIRRQNFNNMADLLWSLSKKCSYVPRHLRDNQDDDENNPLN